MNDLDFYLFDVGHGQCAAARLPNGRWCLFDLGASADDFSPLAWIHPRLNGLPFLATTVSHLHGDHLGGLPWLQHIGTEYLRMPIFDEQYLWDAIATASTKSWTLPVSLRSYYYTNFGSPLAWPDYGGVSITEFSLSAAQARTLGGPPNTRVNNASVVTRIDYAGRSILICGDMEARAWDALLSGLQSSFHWFRHVSAVDVLVAPHHGHTSGYSYAMMNPANPELVLVSVSAKDPSVDSRYSLDSIQGFQFPGKTRRRLTTRRDGHICVTISPRWYGKADLSVTTQKGAPPLRTQEVSEMFATLVGLGSTTGLGK